MFHATRPFVKWSSVENRRASEYGCSYVVEEVTPKAIFSVAAAMAEMLSNGSLLGNLQCVSFCQLLDVCLAMWVYRLCP